MASMAGSTKDTDDRIVAMTYNVCYSLMSNPVNFGNIQKVFNDASREFGHLDLVGIQEPSNNWWNLISTSPALKSLSFIHTREAHEHMVSLYNHLKFTLDAFIPSDIRLKGKTNPQGRPSHILFLTHNLTGKKYIFINIHNGHGGDYKHLEEELSRKVDTKGNDPAHRVIIPIPGENNYHGEKNDQNDPKPIIPYNPNLPFNNKQPNYIPKLKNTSVDYSFTIASNTYEIIFMGDTNFPNVNIWQKSLEFKPLRYMGINIGVSADNTQPPNTLHPGGDVSPSRNIGDYSQIGDYVLISDKLKYDINNAIPSNFNPRITTFPTSDHLPVVSVIRLPKSSHSSSSKHSSTLLPYPTQPSFFSKLSPASASAYPSASPSSSSSSKRAQYSIEYLPSSSKGQTIRQQEFKIETPKTLRMQDNTEDPNKPDSNKKLFYKDNDYPFRGKQVTTAMTLIYPPYSKESLDPATNLVFVQVKNDSNKIGYVNYDYLDLLGNNECQLKKQYASRILRLQNNNHQPHINTDMFPFKGMQISNTDILIFPNGNITKKDLVIVQDKDDPNTIGYIQAKYLKEKHLSKGGGNKKTNKKSNKKTNKKYNKKSNRKHKSKKAKKI